MAPTGMIGLCGLCTASDGRPGYDVRPAPLGADPGGALFVLGAPMSGPVNGFATGLAERMEFECPMCRKPIVTFWGPNGSGLIPSASYVLVVDTIWHPHCWDEQLAKSPP